MLVDITVKFQSGGKPSSLHPVAAIKTRSLEEQQEMWLLRTGIVKFRDITPESTAKYTFTHNSQPLTSLELLQGGDTVEIGLKHSLKPETQ